MVLCFPSPKGGAFFKEILCEVVCVTFLVNHYMYIYVGEEKLPKSTRTQKESTEPTDRNFAVKSCVLDALARNNRDKHLDLKFGHA